MNKDNYIHTPYNDEWIAQRADAAKKRNIFHEEMHSKGENPLGET